MERCLVCKECELSNNVALSRHLRYSHDMSLEAYTLIYKLDLVHPVCKCGCGETVTWHPRLCRFNDFVKGHHRRKAPVHSFVQRRLDLKDDTVIVKRDDLIKLRFDKGEQWVADNVVPVVMDIVKAHVKKNGFIFPPCDETLETVVESLRRDVKRKAGNAWLKANTTAYWEVDKGPVRSFHDDEKLRKVLLYRCGINNSKLYRYDVEGIGEVDTQETFDVSLKEVRKGLIVQRNCVSWFNPSYASNVYSRFLSSVDSPVCWDPSIGFSARMLAFVSMFPTGKYIGTDPAALMYNDAMWLKDEFSSVSNTGEVELHRTGSENFRPAAKSLDLVFTSPPYHDKEKYVDEPGQCWRDYPKLDSWVKSYLIPTFERAFFGLKVGRYMVINIDSHHSRHVIEAAIKAGFVHDVERSSKLFLGVDHFSKRNGKRKNEEHLLAFRK